VAKIAAAIAMDRVPPFDPGRFSPARFAA
jgi:hypothetical protein